MVVLQSNPNNKEGNNKFHLLNSIPLYFVTSMNLTLLYIQFLVSTKAKDKMSMIKSQQYQLQ